MSITEKTDAVAIVVSENGNISYLKGGEFIQFSSEDEIVKILEKDIS